MNQEIRELQNLYQTQFNTEEYIDRGYKDIHEWEEFLITNLHEVEKQGKLRGPRGIDIASGPTAHRMAVLARVCDVVVASDFTKSNREYVSKWLKAKDIGQGFRNIFKRLAKLEGFKDEEEGAKVLAARVRSKVRNVVPCDLTQNPPIDRAHFQEGLFDVGITNGALEGACLNYEGYLNGIRNMASLLKPGAALVFSGYCQGDYYYVGSARFKAFDFEPETAKKALQEAGFRVEIFKVYDKPAPLMAQETSNQAGCFFSLCYKL